VREAFVREASVAKNCSNGGSTKSAQNFKTVSQTFIPDGALRADSSIVSLGCCLVMRMGLSMCTRKP